MSAAVPFPKNEMLDAALGYAARGWRVFPVHGILPDGRCSCRKDCQRDAGKHPTSSGGFKDASSDADQIRAWWRQHPHANIGLATGNGVAVVDVDVCDDKNGTATLRALEQHYGALPATYTVKTGSGGLHYYFDGDIASTIQKLGEGLDTRGEGGYTILPPSRHASGGRYEIEASSEDTLAPLPAWISDLVGSGGTSTSGGGNDEPYEPPTNDNWPTIDERVARARRYLRRCPPAIEGSNGSKVAFKNVSRVVRGFVLPEPEAFTALADWNRTCRPPWPEHQLRHKIRSAANGAREYEWGELLDGRQRVVVGPQISRVVDDCTDALVQADDVYQRDGKLAQVVRVANDEADALALAGTPQIRALTIAALTDQLSRVARFVKIRTVRGNEIEVPTTLPQNYALALADRGSWRGVRPLVGVIESPAMRRDGSLIQTAGYDASTGCLYIPSVPFPEVPATPTRDDATRALSELREVWADFPFANDASREVPLAALLTLLGRPAIAGAVPAFVFEAATRGTGKTLSSDVVAMIATGRASAKMNFPSEDAEREKVLSAYALRGATLVNFDNVGDVFGGAALDKTLTAVDTVELRVLGKSEVPSLKWRAVIFATGNNVALGGDTTRRVLVSRLESTLEESRRPHRVPSPEPASVGGGRTPASRTRGVDDATRIRRRRSP